MMLSSSSITIFHRLIPVPGTDRLPLMSFWPAYHHFPSLCYCHLPNNPSYPLVYPLLSFLPYLRLVRLLRALPLDVFRCKQKGRNRCMSHTCGPQWHYHLLTGGAKLKNLFAILRKRKNHHTELQKILDTAINRVSNLILSYSFLEMSLVYPYDLHASGTYH